MKQSDAMRLLYFVGAGPAAMSRVDIAHLFGERLGRSGLCIEYYLRTPVQGGALMRIPFHDQPAWQCGRSGIAGMPGRVLDKVKEFVATLHFAANALRARHDLIQVRDDFLAGALGLLAARLRRRPFVFWLSYPFPEARLLDAREGRARWPLYARVTGQLAGWSLYRLLLPHADHVFVQSEQMKQDLLRPGVNPARLTPVPMGLPDLDLPPSAPRALEPIVLYLGTLARVRRLSMIIDAFAQVHAAMPAARLVIVGDGDVPEDRAELELAVEGHGLRGAVTFTGQLPRKEALAWVQRASVCLSPFYPTFVLRSTSPTKLVEYLANGKAVVANDHPEQADVIRASGGGLCTGWEAAAFARSTLTLLRDARLRDSMGAAGRAWVVTHRLYSHIASMVLATYSGLLQAHLPQVQKAPTRRP